MTENDSARSSGEHNRVGTALFCVGSVLLALIGATRVPSAATPGSPYALGELLGAMTGTLVVSIVIGFVAARAWQGNMRRWAKWSFWVTLVIVALSFSSSH